MIRITNLIFLIILCVPFIKAQTPVDSNTVIYGWTLDENYITPVKADIDTNLVNYQLYNEVIRKYQSLTSLGAHGSPYIPNSFFEREQNDDLLFLNSYKDYLKTYDNTIYSNTRKPFTHLIYMQSWPKSKREDFIEIVHSQNVNEKLNAGFEVYFGGDKGQYKYLNVKDRKFKIFSSYNGPRYTMHTSFNLNRNIYGENGGVIYNNYIAGEESDTQNDSVYFVGGEYPDYDPGVTNTIRYIDGMLSQSFKILTLGNSSDSSSSGTLAQPVITHVIKARRGAKIYKNSYAYNNQFYDNIYSNINKTYDSITEFKVDNKLQLDFKTKLRNKVMAGVYGSINHEYYNYSYYSELDTSLIDSTQMGIIDGSGITQFDTLYDINTNRSVSNIFISAGLYGKFWTHLETKFNATVYIQGYKAGQTKLDGLLQTNVNIVKRPFAFSVYGAFENIMPSYQLNNYYSNHYIWGKSFNSINKVHLSSKLAAPSNRFDVVGDYSLFRNLIYMSDSMPVAYEQPISIVALTAQKEFIVWKIHSINKFTYQVSENRSVIEIPTLIFYNSTYIDHTWLFKLTDGRLRTMLGVDIYYNSEFNGYNYIPALGLYAQPENNANAFKVGNYPYVDLWFNFRLKRTRFFFKYEHVNQSKSNREHFYATNYPSKMRTLKFGLAWTFYD